MQETFWQFSCRVYRNTAVSSACLGLQNQHGQDVNLLLFAVWHGVTRGHLSESTREAALGFSASWSQEVVQRLRQARIWLKHEALALEGSVGEERTHLLAFREQIKALELQAEHYQQDRLEALCSASSQPLAWPEQRRAAHANLRAIASASTLSEEALEQALDTLLTALFPSPPSAPLANA